MITRCPCCVGKKTLMGLGAMIKECHNCKGVGHVKVVLDHDEPTKVIDSVEQKKRGRPARISNERKEA